MGMNPRYSRWSDDDWRGYAPTLARMADQRWSISAHCPLCGLIIDLDVDRLVRRRGREWSPWGVTSPCVRRGCFGRMAWRATNGRAEREIWLVASVFRTA